MADRKKPVKRDDKPQEPKKMEAAMEKRKRIINKESDFDPITKQALNDLIDVWAPVEWELDKLIDSNVIERESKPSMLSALHTIAENYQRAESLSQRKKSKSIEIEEFSRLEDTLKKAKKLQQSLASLDWLAVKSAQSLDAALSNFVKNNPIPSRPKNRPVNKPKNILLRSFTMVWCAYTPDNQISKKATGFARAFIQSINHPDLELASDKDLLKRFEQAEAMGEAHKIDLPYLIGNYKGIN